MADIQVKDATGTTVYLKAAGAGSSGDPYIPEQSTTAVVAGNVASGVSDSGNPVKVGGLARTTNINAVSQGHRVNAVYDTQGRAIVSMSIGPAMVAGVSADITNTSDTSVIAAQGSGVRTYITQITAFNSHATVATRVNIKDGATTIYSCYLAAAGGQVSITLPVPLRGTANTAVNAACVTTGSNVVVSISGYTGA